MKKNFLYVQKSSLPGAGKGLFTSAFIKKGVIITEYFGEIIDWETHRKRILSGKGDYILILPDKCVDAINAFDCYGRYANDAEGARKVEGLTNNSVYCEKKGRGYIRAIRDIQENEEIFAYYDKRYWEQKKILKIISQLKDYCNALIDGKKTEPNVVEKLLKGYLRK